jgi:hypothetical protein
MATFPKCRTSWPLLHRNRAYANAATGNFVPLRAPRQYVWWGASSKNTPTRVRLQEAISAFFCGGVSEPAAEGPHARNWRVQRAPVSPVCWAHPGAPHQYFVTVLDGVLAKAGQRRAP